jgi:integrase
MNISPALEYWKNELANRSETTRDLYLDNFAKFLDYTGKTADELLRQREEDQTSKDKKIQRNMESQLKGFIAHEEKKGLAPATLQTYFASIRSFFETHYCPLLMRRGDYPKGESIGVRRATKQAILKAVENRDSRHKALTDALILFAKDSGLRESDIRLLNYGDIAKDLESNAKIIPITIVTQKAKIVAKTFLGEESIHALKIYLDARRNGTRTIPPEETTKSSPLFSKWSPDKTAQRMPRTTISNIVRNAFLRVNEPNIAPHSLRKYLQTSLEEAGVNTNWIDQILGHKLINSRDAYSKPTDEQLKEAYTKAYKFLRVYPQLENTNETTQETSEYATETAINLDQLVKLLADGYELKLFKKRK